eukprot:1527835-Pleurochrysis_carterae.AAC.1
MPTSRKSSAILRSGSLNASACAADVLLWSIVRSCAIAFKLPSASRRDAAGRGTLSAAIRRHRRCSNSRRRPRAAACRSGARALGPASRRPP